MVSLSSSNSFFTEVVGKDLKEEGHDESHDYHSRNHFPFQSNHTGTANRTFQRAPDTQAVMEKKTCLSPIDPCILAKSFA